MNEIDSDLPSDMSLGHPVHSLSNAQEQSSVSRAPFSWSILNPGLL